MATDTAALQLRRNGVVFTSTVTVEERREREEKRIRAIEAVHTALEEANKKQTHARPLRRFGCALSVVIVHHKLVNGSPARQRKVVPWPCESTALLAGLSCGLCAALQMTQMMDDMKFDKLHDWVDVTLALKPRAGSICTVQSAERQHLGVHSERPWNLRSIVLHHPGRARPRA